MTEIMRILIVDDKPEGQEILKKLSRRYPRFWRLRRRVPAGCGVGGDNDDKNQHAFQKSPGDGR